MLRPLPADVPPPDKELVKLLGEVSARDIAFLEVADTATQYPKPISDKATELVPNGEIWRSESVARATERARRLIAHGLLE